MLPSQPRAQPQRGCPRRGGRRADHAGHGEPSTGVESGGCGRDRQSRPGTRSTCMGTGASCTLPAAAASARGADHTAADPQVTARTMQMNAFFMKLQTSRDLTSSTAALASSVRRDTRRPRASLILLQSRPPPPTRPAPERGWAAPTVGQSSRPMRGLRAPGRRRYIARAHGTQTSVGAPLSVTSRRPGERHRPSYGLKALSHPIMDSVLRRDCGRCCRVSDRRPRAVP